MNDRPALSGLVPDDLRVRSAKIVLDRLEVQTDIGFHDYEVGRRQRLVVTVEIWLEDLRAPADDDPAGAWDYDFIRSEVERLTQATRYNLQETLAHAIFDRLAALHGVAALRVSTSKPDIYPDAGGVGVEIASFDGPTPPVRPAASAGGTKSVARPLSRR